VETYQDWNPNPVQRSVSGDAKTSNAMMGTPHEEPSVKGVRGRAEECATRSGALRLMTGRLAGRPGGWPAVRVEGDGPGRPEVVEGG
jgi:hypothetical protein